MSIRCLVLRGKEEIEVDAFGVYDRMNDDQSCVVNVEKTLSLFNPICHFKNLPQNLGHLPPNLLDF
jgi:hypothetical protein